MEKYPTKRAYAKPKLVKFLKEKNVYKEFLFNCKNDKINRNDKKQRFFCNISKAFMWEKTKEGHEFWYKLAKEFDE